MTVNFDKSIFRDPHTHARLRHQGDALVNGSVRYPIVRGIPRFVPNENYAADFGEQWNRFPKTQLDSYSGLSITEERLARCFHGELDQLAGKVVLEAGSGAGRFSEVLLKHGAMLHSFDYSSAVEANALNNGDNERLTLAQGDIRAIPFAPEYYDYVVCLGVIQHTPSPEASIASLWKMVKPGGRLIIDHYRSGIRFRLPTPIGDAGSLYRWFVLRMAPERRWPFVKRVTDFWFPVHWRFRDSRLMQRVIRRLSPLRFYYPDLPLKGREMHYEWSLLDTHDSTTDYFKHLRSVEAIRSCMEGLGASDIRVSKGGNGVEAYAVKPVSPHAAEAIS